MLHHSYSFPRTAVKKKYLKIVHFLKVLETNNLSKYDANLVALEMFWTVAV